MNFLTAIINALVGFVQRNPLTVLVILILAIAAPALLKGVALFFLYVVMSILILAVALILVFRWRMNSSAKASIRAISADRVSARPLPESLARAAKAK